jgi:hypothetical protein
VNTDVTHSQLCFSSPVAVIGDRPERVGSPHSSDGNATGAVEMAEATGYRLAHVPINCDVRDIRDWVAVLPFWNKFGL